MGFDPLTQKSVKNTQMEYGTVTFTTTSTTVEVPTRLNTVFIGFGVTLTGQRAASCDKVITSGKVTFTRSAGTESGDTLDYVMAGY